MSGLASAGAARVVVVDSHPVFRRGLEACIGAMEGVEGLTSAASVEEARTRELVTPGSLVLIDHAIDDAHEFITEIASLDGVRVVVCSDCQTDEQVDGSMRAGAIAFLVKRAMRPETLDAALLSAAGGNGFMAADLMPRFIDNGNGSRAAVTPDVAQGTPPDRHAPPLTEREHRVLALIAAGEPTREVARRLCYSERTVKNVLHDVVVKLGARSRSQAVAHAVRHDLI